MKDDHIGPLPGLCFMSLNMTEEQLQVISRAIIDVMILTGSASAESALTLICSQYLNPPTPAEPEESPI